MFSRIDPNTFGQVDRMHVPLGQYLGAAYQQGEHDSMLQSLQRIGRWEHANGSSGGRLMSPDEANESYGIPGRLQFEQEINENQARLMQVEHRHQARREFILAQSKLASPRGLTGFATQIVGANLNPVDVALNFVPVVGPARKAKQIQTASKAVSMFSGTRNRLASGIFGTTDELIGPAKQFQAAIINGAVGNAVAEVPLAISNKKFQLRYGWTDFATNVAFGALFSGGIHGLGRAAGRLLGHLDPIRQHEAFMKGVADALEGRDIDVEPVVRSDPKVAELEADASRLQSVEEEVSDIWQAGDWETDMPRTFQKQGIGEPIAQRTWLDLFLDNLVFNHVKSGVETPAVILRQKGATAKSVKGGKPTLVTAETHDAAVVLAQKEFGADVEYELGYRQRNGGFVSEQTLFEGMNMEEVRLLQAFLRKINQKRLSAVAQDPAFKALHDNDNYRRMLDDKLAELDRMIARAERPDAPVDMVNRIGRQQGEIMRRLNKEFELGLLHDAQQQNYRRGIAEQTQERLNTNRRESVQGAFGPQPSHLKNGGLEGPPPAIDPVPIGDDVTTSDPTGSRVASAVDEQIAELETRTKGLTDEEQAMLMNDDFDEALIKAKESDVKALQIARDCMLSNG